MKYDNDLIAAKLRRWEKYLLHFNLPAWNDIPDVGLYMNQVIVLIESQFKALSLDEGGEVITVSTINNYVRREFMPKPVKKRYYRVHLAYLFIICALKQSLSLSTIQKIMPMGLSSDEVKNIYEQFIDCSRRTSKYFIDEVREIASPILKHDERTYISANETNELITEVAIMSNLLRMLAEKIITLEGMRLQDVPKDKLLPEV